MKRYFFILFFSLLWGKNTFFLQCIPFEVNIIVTSNGDFKKMSYEKINSPIINLTVDDKKNIYIRNGKNVTKLIFLSKNIGNDFYFIEKTSGGSVNLYTLHMGKTSSLTISKSYTVINNTLNVETFFKCY